jgi:hypothetical protein
MLDNTSKWSHARGNTVVPSRWQMTRTSFGNDPLAPASYSRSPPTAVDEPRPDDDSDEN